ncbi:hypothetical protein CVT25_002153 [Psilocybe cyanescens]|uniref:Uncharacterized protein n=1 Tax=Psilocybe cyanescens TaxID=93625 RepID=A0A409X0A6_PSICY|nr:hypothetical protein CVT25_002153 [Psilocybe cyanescens]
MPGMIGYYDKVMSDLNDGSLAYIFRNLFRPPLYTHPASSICSLSLYLHRLSCHNDDDYHDPSYAATHWLSMNPELLQEFKALLRESDITRLGLDGVFRIPVDILWGTKIKHLYLQRVSIYPYCENHDTAPDPEHIPLESLDIDNCASTTKLGPLLPSLTKLHVIIGKFTMFKRLDELLSNTPILQSLALTLKDIG